MYKLIQSNLNYPELVRSPKTVWIIKKKECVFIIWLSQENHKTKFSGAKCAFHSERKLHSRTAKIVTCLASFSQAIFTEEQGVAWKTFLALGIVTTVTPKCYY